MNEQYTDIIWGSAVNDLRLGISMKERRAVLGAVLVVEIFLSYTGAKEIQFFESHVLRDYQIELINGSGQPVPMTALGERTRQSVEAGVHRRTLVRLAPGTQHQVNPSVRLDEWFQLERPGTFTLQIRRKDGQGIQAPLTSGNLSFEIFIP